MHPLPPTVLRWKAMSTVLLCPGGISCAKAAEAYHLLLVCSAGTEATSSPASDVFVKAKVVDWSTRKFARGCYSHPSLGVPSPTPAL